MNKETPTFPRAVRNRTPFPADGTPTDKALRNQIRRLCRELLATRGISHAPDVSEMVVLRRQVSEHFQLSDSCGPWLDVVLNSCFWEAHVATIPFARRMLLVPRLDPAAKASSITVPRSATEISSLACSGLVGHLEKLQQQAREKGILVESLGSGSNVLEHIVHNGTDALIGVGTPSELEPILKHSVLAGIPCIAVPLVTGDSELAIDEDWLEEMVNLPHTSSAVELPRTYLHLMRAAARMFGDEFSRLCPSNHLTASSSGSAATQLFIADPIAATEQVSFNFLRRGGKQSRPFMLLAVYDALTGGYATKTNNPHAASSIPDSVKRTAMSIETFHKASLVHDDIQDEDDFRYGQPAIHKQYGVPLGINIGDYLIGLGYRLVSRDRHVLGGDTASEILEHLADAHQRLCAGQGAELAWRDCAEKRITSADAIQIYALKTAPAFEVAMVCGACLTGQAEKYAAAFRSFAYHLGVAFQILNDLKDWATDPANKKTIGGDLLNGRPTVLWALALEHLPNQEGAELMALARSSGLPDQQRLNRAKEYFLRADVFTKAENLVREYQSQAEQIAENFDSADLRRLLRYIVGSVLARVSPSPTLPA